MLLLMMANKNINCGALILQIIARHKAAGAAAVATAAKQDPVQHQTMASGEKYALPNKPSAKQQEVSICMHVRTYVCSYIIQVQISHTLNATYVSHTCSEISHTKISYTQVNDMRMWEPVACVHAVISSGHTNFFSQVLNNYST